MKIVVKKLDKVTKARKEYHKLLHLSQTENVSLMELNLAWDTLQELIKKEEDGYRDKE
jgi:hypothetical protein